MVDVVNNVSTRFSVVDQASQPLAAMSGAAGRISGMFDRASSVLGSFGVLAGAAAGAFSAVGAIKGTIGFLESVKKVRDFTGMAAKEAGGLIDVLGDAGITGQEAVTAMNRLAMAGNKAKMAATGFGGATRGNLNLFKQFGLAGKTPQQQFMQLAKSAQAHKLSIQQLQQLYRLPPESARKLINVLKEGPGEIKKQIDEFDKLGISTDEHVNSVARIQKLQRQIASGWEKIQLVLVTELLPYIEDAMDYVVKRLPEWIEKAREYGKMFGDFLREHLDLVKAIGKAMMLNFFLQKATGQGLGAWGGKAGGLAKRFLGQAGGAAIDPMSAGRLGRGAAALGKGALATPRAIAGEFTSLFERIVARFSGAKVLSGESLPFVKATPIWARITAGLGRVWPGLLRFTTAALRLAGPLALLMLVITIIWKAVSLIRSNYEGIRTHMSQLIETIMARFSVIGDMLSPIFDVFGDEGIIGKFFTQTVFVVIMALGDMLDGIMHVIQTIIYMFSHWTKLVTHPIETMKKGWAETARLTAEKERLAGIKAAMDLGLERKKKTDDATAEKPPENHIDFRGSKFDITQTFAEGFDPDRIAVAFSNDLAALADKKIGQGFNPLFSGT